jgi:octaprenyl-diphosphate synthase
VRFGIADTLVTGDFLFSRAFEVCGRFEAKIVAWAAEACIQLTEGEIMQGRFRRNAAVTLDDYLEIIDRKTASLFAAGARIAAYLAGGDERMQAMHACGREIGLAFQMIDDVLDVEGEAGKLGKRIGTDLADGNPSLPIIWGLELPAVRRAFARNSSPPELVEEAIAELRSSTVLTRVRDRAIAHAARAADRVRGLPSSPYRDALGEMISELVDREV